MAFKLLLQKWNRRYRLIDDVSMEQSRREIAYSSLPDTQGCNSPFFVNSTFQALKPWTVQITKPPVSSVFHTQL